MLSDGIVYTSPASWFGKAESIWNQLVAGECLQMLNSTFLKLTFSRNKYFAKYSILINTYVLHLQVKHGQARSSRKAYILWQIISDYFVWYETKSSLW